MYVQSCVFKVSIQVEAARRSSHVGSSMPPAGKQFSLPFKRLPCEGQYRRLGLFDHTCGLRRCAAAERAYVHRVQRGHGDQGVPGLREPILRVVHGPALVEVRAAGHLGRPRASDEIYERAGNVDAAKLLSRKMRRNSMRKMRQQFDEHLKQQCGIRNKEHRVLSGPSSVSCHTN